MYQHKHNPSITVEILEGTKRGYKVRQYEKKGNKVKAKIAFYNNEDFEKSERGLFKKN